MNRTQILSKLAAGVTNEELAKVAERFPHLIEEAVREVAGEVEYVMKRPAFRIHRNQWDNWYGYKSGRRVIGFTNGTTETMEEQAKRWLRDRQAGQPAWEWEEK